MPELLRFNRMDGSQEWRLTRAERQRIAKALLLAAQCIERDLEKTRDPELSPELDWLWKLVDSDGSNTELQIELLERELAETRKLHEAFS